MTFSTDRSPSRSSRVDFAVIPGKFPRRHLCERHKKWPSAVVVSKDNKFRAERFRRGRSVSLSTTRRLASVSGSGRSRSALTKLKMAVFAPRPRASVRTAMTVNAGRFSKLRTVTLMSLSNVSMATDPGFEFATARRIPFATGVAQKSVYRSSLCNLCVFCVSIVHYFVRKPPQRQ
jgi:hypothetical protein